VFNLYSIDLFDYKARRDKRRAFFVRLVGAFTCGRQVPYGG
jgi:hypothetical protein